MGKRKKKPTKTTESIETDALIKTIVEDAKTDVLLELKKTTDDNSETFSSSEIQLKAKEKKKSEQVSEEIQVKLKLPKKPEVSEDIAVEATVDLKNEVVKTTANIPLKKKKTKPTKVVEEQVEEVIKIK